MRISAKTVIRFQPYQTQYTREMLADKRNPQIYMWNGKPYRTRAQKAVSKKVQRKGNDGNWFSSAPVSQHPRPLH